MGFSSINAAAKNPVRPRKNTAEGGCGGNSAVFLQKIEANPVALLGQSRTQQKNFLFLLEEKIRRTQNQKRRENFFAGWRVATSSGGAPVRLWRSFIRRGVPENAFGFRSGCGARWDDTSSPPRGFAPRRANRQEFSTTFWVQSKSLSSAKHGSSQFFFFRRRRKAKR